MSAEKIVLYHYWRSSCSWRVRWALSLKEVLYRSVAINLLKGEQESDEYKKLNPSAFVPGLVINGQAFGESMAMVEWIEEKWPNPPLLPQNLEDRMRVRQLYLTIAAGTQPLQNLAPQKFHSSDREKQQQFARHWICRGLSAYETILSERKATLYSFGETVTMADLCLIPQCYNALRYGVDLREYPRIKEIYEICMATDACIKSHPDNQEDAIRS